MGIFPYGLASAATGSVELKDGDALATIFSVTNSENAKKPEFLKSLSIKPVIYQPKDGDGAALGLSYQLLLRPYVVDLIVEDGPGTSPSSWSSKMLTLDAEVKGVYHAKAATNIENVIDAKGLMTFRLGKGEWSTKTAVGGSFAKRQDSDSQETAWEISETVGVIFPRLGYSQAFVRTVLAYVNPSNNKAREKALGTEAENFKRLEIEAFLNVPINRGMLRKVELRHLLFSELAPPEKIKDAGLNKARLSSVYLALDNDFFIAYTRGNVPEDQKSKAVLTLGWSTNIK